MGVMTGDDLNKSTVVGVCFTFRQFVLAPLLSPSLALQPWSVSICSGNPLLIFVGHSNSELAAPNFRKQLSLIWTEVQGSHCHRLLRNLKSVVSWLMLARALTQTFFPPRLCITLQFTWRDVLLCSSSYPNNSSNHRKDSESLLKISISAE